MTEDFLSLEIGTKVWTIQLGDCFIFNKKDDSPESAYCIECKTEGGRRISYDRIGRFMHTDSHPSLFKENPFKNKIEVFYLDLNDDTVKSRKVEKELAKMFLDIDNTIQVCEPRPGFFKLTHFKNNTFNMEVSLDNWTTEQDAIDALKSGNYKPIYHKGENGDI